VADVLCRRRELFGIDILYEHWRQRKSASTKRDDVDQLRNRSTIRLCRALAPLREFEIFSYVRSAGQVQRDRVIRSSGAGTRAIIVPSMTRHHPCGSEPQGALALETELSRAGFERKNPPASIKGVPYGTTIRARARYSSEKFSLKAS